MRVPLRVYSLPGMRFLYATVSTMVDTLSVMTFLSPSWPSAAVVPMVGWMTVTVCPSSSISLCSAISTPLRARLSKTTRSVPSSMARVSKVKATSTLPSAVSDVKVAEPVTGSPSISSGSPVSLTMSVPETVYSLPGSRPLYSTVSMTVVSSSVTTVLSPSTLSVAEVEICGCSAVTVWALSLMSAWTAISTPARSRDSNATISVPWGMRRESNVNTTSTVPSALLGVKVVSAVTGSPSTNRGSSDAPPSSVMPLTMRVPLTVYSLPGMSPV